MAELTHKDLQEAAKNINAVFGDDITKIKTISSRPNLEKGIKDALGPFVSTGDTRIDQLTEATIDTYNVLIQPAEEGAEAGEVAEAGEEEGPCPVFGKEFDASAPECTDCQQAEECSTMTQVVAKKGGGKAKKTDEEKAAAKAEKARIKAERAADKPVKYSWTQAAVDAIKLGDMTKEELAVKTRALYIENGGESENEVVAVRYVYSILGVLGAAGVIREAGGKYSFSTE